MRPDRSAQRVLSTTRAKAKMYEYAVPLDDHIDLPVHPNVLFSLAVGLVGDAAAALASGRPDDLRRATSVEAIKFAATFFDAYIDAQLDDRVREEFSLLAASSYYLADLPGNARLLASRTRAPNFEGAWGLDWLTFRLLNSNFDVSDEERSRHPHLSSVLADIRAYMTARGEAVALLENVLALRADAYDIGDGRAVLYADLVVAVCKKKIENASRTQLPAASALPLDAWPLVKS